MTTSAAIPRWNRPVEAWKPSLDRAELAAVLHKVRAWTPFNPEALLDDVAEALDEVAPDEQDVDDLVQRLRGNLMQLVDIAVATEAGQKDQDAHRLIHQARTIRSEEMPGDHRQAIGHLRRMGWTANELLERLVALHCLKEAA
ncbi:DUF6415 family natural product biosynthesis protein [Streptomyces sp. NPDC090026]|uniref:DUF6415 family natural product biosynthesis protein n=1 Tax=Streptomyces sp. NPDC090026 TaxID=3365923 RepID=UPI003810D849